MKKIFNIGLYTGKSYVPEACVLIDGAKIAYAGEAAACPPSPACEQIDGGGALCMPGFYNAHCHAAMTLERGVGSDLNLMDWLGQIFPIEDKLTPEFVYWGTMLAIVEMIRRGTVAFADQYFFMDEVGRAAVESGIRANICRGSNTREGVDSTTDLFNSWHGAGEGRVRVLMGVHSEYLTEPEMVDYAVERAGELGVGFHVHVSETMSEVAGCYQRHGVSPVRFFEQRRLFDRPAIAAHCVHVSDADIEILARKGVYVAHNPASNLKLGSGVARVAEMLERGVRVALGTDGPSSNNALDMMADMRLASLLQKGFRQDPTLLPAAQAIRMATRTGAQALGYENCGLIEAGAQADLILIDEGCENMAISPDPAAAIVFAAQGLNVRLTMVNGKALYRDGAFLTLDMEEIVAKARETARAMGVI